MESLASQYLPTRTHKKSLNFLVEYCERKLKTLFKTRNNIIKHSLPVIYTERLLNIRSKCAGKLRQTERGDTIHLDSVIHNRLI